MNDEQIVFLMHFTSIDYQTLKHLPIHEAADLYKASIEVYKQINGVKNGK